MEWSSLEQGPPIQSIIQLTNIEQESLFQHSSQSRYPNKTQQLFKMCTPYQNNNPDTIPSQRGSSKIALKGHYYLMDRRDPNNPNRSYWKCDSSNQGCRARLIKKADGSLKERKNEHTCQMNFGRGEAACWEFNLKEEIQTKESVRNLESRYD